MNDKSISRTSPEDVVSFLEGLSEESQFIPLDNIAMFDNWYKRFRYTCRIAGEKPYDIYLNFSKHHLGPIILGESYTRDEIAGILNDAPNCIQVIINIVKVYGVVPIKEKN